jgi:BRO1-like domain
MTDTTNFDTTPASLVRLASVVYRFRVPTPTKKICFVKAFKTVGTATATQTLLQNADLARDNLSAACDQQSTVPTSRIIDDCIRYHPFIHTILVSCKVQPDQARLDEKLFFEWKSGLEAKPIPNKNEFMMYDYLMTLACQGLAYGASATQNSAAGEFAAASRDYSTAAGIFTSLADEQLPKWTTKHDTNEEFLPLECNPIVAKAVAMLFMANGQQMAIATLLVKDGKPNYSLVAKLCFGIVEQLEAVTAFVKGKAPVQQGKMEQDFFTLMQVQIAIHKSVSCYYQARAAWDRDEHGVAIAMLAEAIRISHYQKKPTDTVGIPDVSKHPNLKHLSVDIVSFRDTHMIPLQRLWEKENSSIYFAPVPKSIPSGKFLTEGVQMKKKTDFIITSVEPVLLSVPKYSILNVGGLFGPKKTVS